MTKEQVENHSHIINVFMAQGVAVYITDTNTVHLADTAEILFKADGHTIEALETAMIEWCCEGGQVDGVYIAPF
jgi:hypothetical protein